MRAFHNVLRRYYTTTTTSTTTTTTRSVSSSCVNILPEVSNALSSNQPVVALESTIIAHGMPYPQNIELANDISQILRDRGCIPATIAIKNGIFKAGLHSDEMEDLALAGQEGRAVKCSTRDLPLVASKQRYNTSSDHNVWGATTVAATMRLSHLAGISTFVTGGTGGVHRGGELSLDISTDLIELSRTPLVVISAGVKSILDVKKTLEVLETYAVPTGTWRSDEFPAFFSPQSGVQSPTRFDSANDVASAYLIGKELGLENGMLVAVPNYDPAGENVETAIQEALQEAEVAGIEGNDVTPFILKTVAEKTSGDSLRSNIALVKNNAKVGAEIATSLSNMSQKESTKTTIQSSKLPLPRSRVVCVGGAVIDTVAKSNTESKLIIGTSNPGVIHQSDGGVGRNVAEVLGRLGSKPVFYTAIGEDSCGQGIVSRLEEESGVITTARSVKVAKAYRTAQYLALLDHNRDLVGGVADMDVLSEIPIPDTSDLHGVEYLVVDSNGPVESITKAAQNGAEAGCQICFEPTSVPKAAILSSVEFVESLNYIFPNEDELIAMAKEIADDELGLREERSIPDDEYKMIKEAASTVLSVMKAENAHIICTLGSRGVMLASKKDGIEFLHFPADVVSVKSSNGAGDTLCGAFIHALLQGATEEEAVRFGMKASLLSLDSEEHAISPEISSLYFSLV